MSVKQQIQELRMNGYVVRCKHVRYFPHIGLLEQETPTVIVDQFLSKGEMMKGLEENRIVTLDNSVQNMMFGDNVSPRDGFCLVEIFKDGIMLSRGKKNFSKQPYNKKVGLTAAFNRALFYLES